MIELLDSLPVLSSMQSNELSNTKSVQIEVGWRQNHHILEMTPMSDTWPL